ncbi:MAG: FAD-dependent monooxygenase [Micromonosporaceae bacterium]|nr:FAD-dependent monooxygenase [Micromonosporaceae bacterium]
MSSGSVYDHQLNLLYAHQRRDAPLDPATASRGVNRLTVRQILLTGIPVHFGRTVVGVRSGTDRAWLDFADGSTVCADLVIGADGINSMVRRNLAPDAGLVDTGLRAIYGQSPLVEELVERLPGPLFGGSSPVLGPHRQTLALGSYQPVVPHAEAVARTAPHARLDSFPDYMKWTLVAPAHQFALRGPALWRASARRLHEQARQCTADWHPALAMLVERAEIPVTFPLAIRASAPPDWPSGRVTLLGDAAHATTPVGGTGANTALRDAALLTQRLRRVIEGRLHLSEAVRGYEEQMRDYGSTAVRNSLRGAQKIFRADPAEFSSALVGVG